MLTLSAGRPLKGKRRRLATRKTELHIFLTLFPPGSNVHTNRVSSHAVYY
jgi:hypothetical protein